MSKGLLIGGGLALLLMSRKKKRISKNEGSPTDSVSSDQENRIDQSGSDSSETDPDSVGDYNGKTPSKLSKGSIWVSPDCKKVIYGDDDGEGFWNSKGIPTAQNFIKANYNDPYEIAKIMAMPLAPCAVEFPVMADGFEPMEEEFRRELFNRDYKDVYYLIQFFYDKILQLMNREELAVEFDDSCDIVFVGEDWVPLTADRMARFYVDYMYPIASDFQDHSSRFISWPLADPNEKSMVWWDNIATAIINRLNKDCGISIVEAFKKEPFSANSFFIKRPGLKAFYTSLVNLINSVQDQQKGSLDFKKLDEIRRS